MTERKPQSPFPPESHAACWHVEFVAQAAHVRLLIDQIKTNVDKMRKKHSTILSAPKMDDSNSCVITPWLDFQRIFLSLFIHLEIRLEIENLSAEIKETANKVRSRIKSNHFKPSLLHWNFLMANRMLLKGFEKATETEPNRTSAELRIRQTQISTLSHEFVAIMTECNRVQVEHREQCKRRFKRQLELSKFPYSFVNFVKFDVNLDSFVAFLN